VATQTGAAFEQGHLMVVAQHMRRPHAGNTRADDGNLSVACQRVVLWRVDGFKWHKARISSLSGLYRQFR
jgi:hypothetical protein